MRAWSLILPLLSVPLTAQDSLADLERRFAAEHERLYAEDRRPTQEQELALVKEHARQLADFLGEQARGDDRWRGRLLLADIRLMLDDRDGAVAALRGIDGKQAPGPLLLMAADVATQLGERTLRSEWIEAALAGTASFEQRMEMARLLMTLLTEVERGEAIFTAALAAAKDPEDQARVRWYRCKAIREREDLPENSYYDALEQLARDLPDTYYGSVARDRCTASHFAIGEPAIPFTRRSTQGDEVSLQELRGRPVVLVFWAPTQGPTDDLAKALQAIGKRGETALLGISMDEDQAAFAAAVERLGVGFPQICDGRGYAADLALRYHVETAPTLIVLDREGRITGLNLHTDTRDAREQLEQALLRAQ